MEGINKCQFSNMYAGMHMHALHLNMCVACVCFRMAFGGVCILEHQWVVYAYDVSCCFCFLVVVVCVFVCVYQWVVCVYVSATTHAWRGVVVGDPGLGLQHEKTNYAMWQNI